MTILIQDKNIDSLFFNLIIIRKKNPRLINNLPGLNLNKSKCIYFNINSEIINSNFKIPTRLPEKLQIAQIIFSLEFFNKIKYFRIICLYNFVFVILCDLMKNKFNLQIK